MYYTLRLFRIAVDRTYRIVYKCITLIVNENQPSPCVVRKQPSDSYNMSELIDNTPVFNVEKVQFTSLK